MKYTLRRLAAVTVALSTGQVMRSCLVAGLLCAMAPAQADWSWKSALIWSSSTADCTAGAATDSQDRFRFGNTAATATCGTVGVNPWATANANAMDGWGGGGGGGNAGGGGTFGRSRGADLTLLADSAVQITSIAVGTDALVLSGMSSFAGSATIELGAFIFRGDPGSVFGPPGTESGAAALNIAGLIAAGIISASDVIFDWTDAQVPSTLTDLSVPIPLALQADRDLLVVEAWSHGATAAPVPEPSTGLLLGGGLLAVLAVARRRRA